MFDIKMEWKICWKSSFFDEFLTQKTSQEIFLWLKSYEDEAENVWEKCIASFLQGSYIAHTFAFHSSDWPIVSFSSPRGISHLISHVFFLTRLL